jgi:hypothetical protein
MSIFWDHRARKPQLWVYPFFLLLTVLVFIAIYQYGSMKADQAGLASPDGVIQKQ